MPDYYVAFVKEYLELQGFIVRTETKYRMRKKDKRGILRASWGDIDILAVKVGDNKVSELIVGEVKAEQKNEKEIREINRNKFENPFVKRKLEELFGTTKCRKCLYCWSWEPKTRDFAEKLSIELVSFEEIVTQLLEKVVERKGWLYLKDYPNLMLLQFLESNDLLKDDRK